MWHKLTGASPALWEMRAPQGMRGAQRHLLGSSISAALICLQSSRVSWPNSASHWQVLIPVFALGRAQELCILLETFW